MAGSSTKERLIRGVNRATGAASRRELVALRKRVNELESEVQEARRLNVRVAELLDIVEELVVPLAQRDEDKVRAYLEAHTTRL